MPELNLLHCGMHVHVPDAQGAIKTSPEDFRVEEILGFQPDGSGEHAWLFIEKQGVNTQDLVNLLARRLMIHPKNISYAGLKDRQAITRQWISITTAKVVDTTALESTGIRVLESSRHHCKLKRGAHKANRFEIVIRDVSELAGIDQRLERVVARGVPNYFGDQRFGRGGKNIEKALALFAGQIRVDRHQRGMYLSAARAGLFNAVLSERVRQGNWATGMAGETMMLNGSNSFFRTEALDDVLRSRLREFDIHPSAPLWGKGELLSSGEAYALESEVMAGYPELTRGLEDFGLRQQRRATRLIPQNLAYEYPDEQTIKLKFQLDKGAFATTVLRELITISS